MDREEAWSHIVLAIEKHFTRGTWGAPRGEAWNKDEWEVDHNDNAQTITLIHRETNSALELTNTTFTHRTGGATPEDPVHIVFKP